MHVPNWLIALELSAGALLLYISSSALVNTDMHLSRSVSTPPAIETQEKISSHAEEKIILSAHSGSALYTK